MAYAPTSPEVGSALNASVVTGEAEFYLNNAANGTRLGNITMHKNVAKPSLKDRWVSVRGGGRALGNRVNVQAELSYEIQLDEQTLENMAMLFFGSSTQTGYNQAAITAPTGTMTITSSLQRAVYDIGKLNVVSVLVKDAVPTTYVAGTDYILDAERGTIYIVDGGAIVNGTALTITYGCTAVKMDTITALTNLNFAGTFVLYESDEYSTTLFKQIWSGAATLTPSQFPEENAEFSKFAFTVTFLGSPTIRKRQQIAGYPA